MCNKEVSLIVQSLVLYMYGYVVCRLVINQVLRIIQIAVKSDVKTGRIYKS